MTVRRRSCPRVSPRKRRKKRAAATRRSLPSLEVASDNHLKKPKHRDSQKTKSDKKPGPDSVDAGKGEGKTQDGRVKASKAGEEDAEDGFEEPTMSFESYLSYDQPKKKKKKVVKTSAPALGEKGLKKRL